MATPTGGDTVSSVPYSGLNRVDALLIGTKWGGPAGTGATIEYSFPSSGGATSYWASNYYYGEPFAADFAPLGAAEQAAFKAALAAWAEVANIDFIQVADNASIVGDIRVAYSGAVNAGNPNIVAWGYYPGNYTEGGDIWLSPSWSSNYASSGTMVPGGRGFYTLLHELGHALGLDHSFTGVVVPAAQDSDQYTVMAYAQSPYATIRATEPMLYDIAAIQYLYGPNMATRTGNDVYGYSAGVEERQAIWDAGGIDRIDASNQTLSATIDLNDGAFSSIGVRNDGAPAQFNVAIAYGAVIENATGGSAGDRLIGNSIANVLNGNAGNDTMSGNGGNDTLAGGAGQDQLTGGAGADLFDHDGAASGLDSIADFQLGAGGDVLDFRGAISGYTGNVADYVQLVSGGGNTVVRIDADGGVDNFSDAVTLVGLTGLSADTLVANGNILLSGSVSPLPPPPSPSPPSGGSSIVGTRRKDDLAGTGGDDTMSGLGGSDTLSGGGGEDSLMGGAGKDALIGGLGADIFDYNSVSEAGKGTKKRDAISDFNEAEGDRIDLSTIDAVKGTGDQAFDFIGGAAFGKVAGELRFENGLLQGDTTGDGKLDFEIALTGVVSLAESSIVL